MKIGEIKTNCETEREKDCNAELRTEIAQINGLFELLIIDAERIMHLDPDRNPLQNIDEVLADSESIACVNDSNPGYNTWPFGTPTEKVYPGFLAVCRGKQNLGGVLQVVERQCKKMSKECKDDKKGSLIITDKWDPEAFRKHEKKLLKYASEEGIWIVILLVTEYGYTQIPFLPNDRKFFEKHSVNMVEDDVTLDDLFRLMDVDNGRFYYHASAGTLDRFGGEDYTFYDNCCWERHSYNGERGGYITESAMCRFLKKVLWIAELDQDKVSMVNSSDAPIFRLHIFGKEVEWDVSLVGDKKYKELVNNVDQLIKACKEKK